MRSLRNIALGVLLFSAASFPALAGTITWDLTGVTGSDGAAYSGSFAYNADTNVYSSIDIVSTGGTLTPPDTYTFQVNPSIEDSNFLVPLASPPAVGVWLLNLEFAGTGLTDAGGTIAIAATDGHDVAAGTCAESDCYSFDPVSTITGSVVAEIATPEPPVFVLLGSALLLAVFRKKLLAVF